MVKVAGLFLDYDGTISPLDVPRQQSCVLPHLAVLLNLVQKSLPIGIITTKDLHFILARTSFARAWGAIGGLEMKTGSLLVKAKGVEETLPHLRRALQYAWQNLCEDAVIEEKCDSSGQPLAFCVDWRQVKSGKEPRKMAANILAFCKMLPLEVVEYPPGQPYFDVYPCSIDKGKALKTLKEHLGLSSGVLYMGDSLTDNPAFKEANIGIGVSRNEKPPELDCDFWLKFEDVACFLGSLFKNQFLFSANLPGIKVRR